MLFDVREPALHLFLFFLLLFLDRVRTQIQRKHEGADRHAHGDDRKTLPSEKTVHDREYHFDQVLDRQYQQSIQQIHLS